MLLVVMRIFNAMICEALLPDSVLEIEFPCGAKRKSSLDVLDRLFERSFSLRSDQEKKVIGHNDKFVEEKSALVTVLDEDVDKKRSHAFGLEDRATPVRDRCNEESALVLWSKKHEVAPGLKPCNRSAFIRRPEGLRFHRAESCRSMAQSAF